jgi:rubrerythrin
MTTMNNLKDAFAGESQANRKYLAFANKVESIHAGLYQRTLDNLGNNETVDYYVCQVCCNTIENDAPDKCPICGANKSMFTKIN